MRSFTITLLLVALCSVLAFCPQHVEGALALAVKNNNLARGLIVARQNEESSIAGDPSVETTILEDPATTAVETDTAAEPVAPVTTADPVFPTTAASVQVISIGGPPTATRSVVASVARTTSLRSIASAASKPSSSIIKASSSLSSSKPSSSAPARASASTSRASSGIKTLSSSLGRGGLGGIAAAMVFGAVVLLV